MVGGAPGRRGRDIPHNGWPLGLSVVCQVVRTKELDEEEEMKKGVTSRDDASWPEMCTQYPQVACSVGRICY